MIFETEHPLPYYAVIFASIRTEGDNGYSLMADLIENKLKDFDGYLGMDHATDETGVRLTVCYWESMEAIAAWKNDKEHLEAQLLGKAVWYEDYSVRVARVEKAY